ncbi:MAG: cobyric acid synthase [Gemmataceae bacterium]|nr:cobyric acid synthase [Gemmataceae bacterium]MDW8266982.1 cobyric acid synthase [Gemmataceae bacterium]
MPRALMIQGTASHVGKSVLTAAFARWLSDGGWRVAPFKAQNMSLNSFVTLQGEEIARSQAVQAEALGLEPTADMNPILLKPLDSGCQVIARGHPVGLMSIHDYYAWKGHAWRAITESYDRLARAFEVIVLEGAGSPAEINLREHDLANMRMAHHADAVVVIVADIERGGVFAQLVGTWELLSPEERRRVVGFLINKFRGDPSLLSAGLAYLRQRTGRPVLGVLPYDPSLALDEEDSLGLTATTPTGEIDVAVICLPGISNFTDVAPLARVPGVGVRLVSEAGHLRRPDLIILPGTRTTQRARAWLRACRLDDAIRAAAGQPDGPYVLGLCGGYQLLGHAIDDPDGVEAPGQSEGLGLLDVDTRFHRHKTLYRVEAEVLARGSLGDGCPVVGYEVHQGITQRRPGVAPWLRLRRRPGGDSSDDGAIRPDGRVLGTYVHGLFDDARFCRAVVHELRRRKGLPPLTDDAWERHRRAWAERYERLVCWLTQHCVLGPIVEACRLERGRC